MEYVWYSPEWDMIHVCKKSEAFQFKDEYGTFIKCYKFSDFCKLSDFYLIGEYEQG